MPELWLALLVAIVSMVHSVVGSIDHRRAIRGMERFAFPPTRTVAISDELPFFD